MTTCPWEGFEFKNGVCYKVGYDMEYTLIANNAIPANNTFTKDGTAGPDNGCYDYSAYNQEKSSAMCEARCEANQKCKGFFAHSTGRCCMYSDWVGDTNVTGGVTGQFFKKVDPVTPAQQCVEAGGVTVHSFELLSEDQVCAGLDTGAFFIKSSGQCTGDCTMYADGAAEACTQDCCQSACDSFDYCTHYVSMDNSACQLFSSACSLVDAPQGRSLVRTYRMAAASDAVMNDVREVRIDQAFTTDPVLFWDFEGTTPLRDVVSNLELTLGGGALIENGALALPKNSAQPFALTEEPGAVKFSADNGHMTLSVSVKLANVTEPDKGAAIAVVNQNGEFDAIVYGEILSNQWMAGSDNFRRTVEFDNKGELEDSAEWVHLVSTFGTSGICLYRNGLPYGDCYQVTEDALLRHFGLSGDKIMFGPRHMSSLNQYTGALHGHIDNVAVFAKELSPDEVGELFVSIKTSRPVCKKWHNRHPMPPSPPPPPSPSPPPAPSPPSPSPPVSPSPPPSPDSPPGADPSGYWRSGLTGHVMRLDHETLMGYDPQTGTPMFQYSLTERHMTLHMGPMQIEGDLSEDGNSVDFTDSPLPDTWTKVGAPPESPGGL